MIGPTTPESISDLLKYPIAAQNAYGVTMENSKVDANYRDLGDVHWNDLYFYLNNARILKDTESFAICERVLKALKLQVLKQK